MRKRHITFNFLNKKNNGFLETSSADENSNNSYSNDKYCDNDDFYEHCNKDNKDFYNEHNYDINQKLLFNTTELEIENNANTSERNFYDLSSEIVNDYAKDKNQSNFDHINNAYKNDIFNSENISPDHLLYQYFSVKNHDDFIKTFYKKNIFCNNNLLNNNYNKLYLLNGENQNKMYREHIVDDYYLPFNNTRKTDFINSIIPETKKLNDLTDFNFFKNMINFQSEKKHLKKNYNETSDIYFDKNNIIENLGTDNYFILYENEYKKFISEQENAAKNYEDDSMCIDDKFVFEKEIKKEKILLKKGKKGFIDYNENIDEFNDLQDLLKLNYLSDKYESDFLNSKDITNKNFYSKGSYFNENIDDQNKRKTKTHDKDILYLIFIISLIFLFLMIFIYKIFYNYIAIIF